MSKDQIDKMVRTKFLTHHGGEWLKAALDPFHDYSLEVRGYPDINSSPSLVMAVQKMVVLDKPTWFPDGNWDVNIAWSPVTFSAGTDTDSIWGVWDCATGLFTRSGATGVVPTGLTAWAAPANQGTFQRNTSGDTIRATTIPLGEMHPSENGGRPVLCRIIAGGFEVENSTAIVAKQGAVTVYNMANSGDNLGRAVVLQVDGTPCADLTAVVASLPPSSVNEAKLFTDSRTWGAEEGCYCPLKLGTTDNPPTWTLPHPVMFSDMTSTEPGGSCLVVYETQQRLGTATSAGDPFTNFVTPTVHHNQFSTTGAYFTGLSPETTLNLTLRAYIEFFPTSNTRDARLSTPGCPYDPRALELYSRIVARLPPGTYRDNNDSGDWFRMVGRVLSELAVAAVPQLAYPIKQVTNAVMQGHTMEGDLRGIGRDVKKAFTKKKKPVAPQQQKQRDVPNFQHSRLSNVQKAWLRKQGLM